MRFTGNYTSAAGDESFKTWKPHPLSDHYPSIT